MAKGVGIADGGSVAVGAGVAAGGAAVGVTVGVGVAVGASVAVGAVVAVAGGGTVSCAAGPGGAPESTRHPAVSAIATASAIANQYRQTNIARSSNAILS